MSTYTIPLSNPVASNIFVDTSNGATASQVKTSSAVLFLVEVDNSAGSIEVFTKIYNVSSAPSVGTTAPHDIIRTPAGAVNPRTYGLGEGVTHGTGIFIATVTTGGTGGTTAPTSSVSVKVMYT